ncbi:MAG TPA: ribonuclease HII, partial [Burkholderiales bacterium]|nr:ribonuclease HII [Burkholderiales bacterium]
MNARGTVCGVDEAGRGPLAGPVYAAAVILAKNVVIDGLGDSKTIPAPRREALATEIKDRASAWAVASASVAEIDSLNILRASLLAMKRAVEGLGIVPRRVVVDGLHCPELPCPVRAIVRGDATVAAISAASILAKVSRDAKMMELHLRYPQYGFDCHKGYATEMHLAALRAHGACEIHR